jgi:hypothetical protein
VKIGGREERGVARSGRHDEVARAGDVTRRRGDLDAKAVGLHVGAIRGHCVGPPPPHQNVATVRHHLEELELHPRLHPSPEDPDAGNGSSREMLGDDRPGGCRSDVGQMPLVQQDRRELPGLLAEEKHEAGVRGEAALRVVIEARGDLDDEVLVTGT